MNLKRKSVAFNLEDPDQIKLWNHANKRTNFSYYVKTLILRDMEGMTSQTVTQDKQSVHEDVPTDFMDGFI